MTYCADHRFLQFQSVRVLAYSINKTGRTRTTKHTNQFTGTAAIITDRDNVIEHTIVGLSEIGKYVDEMIGSCTRQFRTTSIM